MRRLSVSGLIPRWAVQGGTLVFCLISRPQFAFCVCLGGSFRSFLDPKVSSRIVVSSLEEGNHKLSLCQVLCAFFRFVLNRYGYQLAMTVSCFQDLRLIAELLQDLRLYAWPSELLQDLRLYAVPELWLC